MTDVLEARVRERDRLIKIAHQFVERLPAEIALRAAAVVGSVARGDFNVWSDIDVVLIAEGLPRRLTERSALLAAAAPPGVQPVGFLPDEFEAALQRKNPLALEVLADGVILAGEEFLVHHATHRKR